MMNYTYILELEVLFVVVVVKNTVSKHEQIMSRIKMVPFLFPQESSVVKSKQSHLHISRFEHWPRSPNWLSLVRLRLSQKTRVYLGEFPQRGVEGDSLIPKVIPYILICCCMIQEEILLCLKCIKPWMKDCQIGQF